MISVNQAIEIVKQNGGVGASQKMHLNEALHLFLSENVYAPIPVPSFHQSAMDGYAFKFKDIDFALEIVDEIPAGDTRDIEVKAKQAIRIFTGAKVPESCDTVVMQELTEVNEHKLLVKDTALKLGGNIRKEGHQIKAGELALAKGTQITPAAVGFLASLGCVEVKVFTPPRVSILATGNELVQPGNTLQKGQVYESNTRMLEAALNQLNIKPAIIFLPDHFELTQQAIAKAIQRADILIISGGISVGDYDFVKPALEANQVQQLFYKVNQKPGKPLFFGKKENKLVFALPGNPAAALNCFYIYVRPAIGMYTGNPAPFLPAVKRSIHQSHQKKSGRAEFLKAFSNGENVTLLEGQGSDVLRSFVKANCLVFLEDNINQVKAGDVVLTYMLPV